jgi:hypothetical protein
VRVFARPIDSSEGGTDCHLHLLEHRPRT